MTLSSKIKNQLLVEAKKLQRRISLLKKKEETVHSNSNITFHDTRWDEFFNNSLNTILIVDSNGSLLDINKVEPGLKKAEVIGLSAYSFIAADSINNMKGAIKKVFSTRKSQEYDCWRKAEDGSFRYYKSKASAVLKNNEVVAAVIDVTDVTAEKMFELELKRSRENYKSLINHSPDGIIIHIKGNIKFANPSALNILGIDSIEELNRMSLLNFVLPDYRKQILKRAIKAKSGEELKFLEVQIKNKRGKIILLETKSVLVNYNGQEAIQVVFHNLSEKKLLKKEKERAKIAESTNTLLKQEISKRKRIEKRLMEAQKFSQLIINSSIDMICAFDENGYITEFNPAALKTFDYKYEEVIGNQIDILYEKEQLMVVEEELSKNGIFTGEVTNLRKNGEKFVSYLSATVLINEIGEKVGAMTVSRDISELKKADETFRTQSAKFNAIIESSSHIIWNVDKNYCLTMYNKNFDDLLLKQFGVNAKIGLSLVTDTMISTPDNNNFWISKINKAFEGTPQYFESLFVEKGFADKEGAKSWREIYLNPIFGEDGTVKEVSGIGHDITEKKLSEERIRQSLREKEVLLKEVHHRVKNNLQVISSILNLQSFYIKDEGAVTVLRESQNRIKAMATIHENFYQTRELSSINFTEYVQSLSSSLKHSYSYFGNELKFNLDIQNVFLNLDEAILCGLIINEIVSNALKHAFVDNRSEGEIKLIMKVDGDDLILKIGDNGKGLPKEIDYRNTESLGLQLVVTLTNQLDGTITLEEEKGTNYKIIFKHKKVNNYL